jgi:hypothetical protein
LWLKEYALYLRTAAMTRVRVSVDSRAQLSAVIGQLAASQSGFYLRAPVGSAPEGARLDVEAMVALPSGWGLDALRRDEVVALAMMEHALRSMLGQRRQLNLVFELSATPVTASPRTAQSRAPETNRDLCPICLEALGTEETVLLACGHRVHRGCYNRARRFPSGARCSVCRRPVSAEEPPVVEAAALPAPSVYIDPETLQHWTPDDASPAGWHYLDSKEFKDPQTGQRWRWIGEGLYSYRTGLYDI